FFAAVQGILERHDVESLAKSKGLQDVGAVEAVAPLLRDLPPEKGGGLALALWDREAKKGWQARGATGFPTLKARLWLAGARSTVGRDKARDVFRAGVESHAPALRLFAGLGAARISDGAVPFRLTAPRADTAAARKKWLAGLKVRKADDWRFD